MPTTPPGGGTSVLAEGGVPRALRDGTVVQVRLLGPADGDLLREFHSTLSLEATRLRYFTPKPRLSDKDIAWLTDVDVVNRCALVVVEHGRIIAVGRWMREAEGSPRAEVAFVTADRERGRGIASLLLAMLIELAPDHGITTFTASVMVENSPMRSVFRRSGYAMTVTSDANVRELTIDLTSPVDD